MPTRKAHVLEHWQGLVQPHSPILAKLTELIKQFQQLRPSPRSSSPRAGGADGGGGARALALVQGVGPLCGRLHLPARLVRNSFVKFMFCAADLNCSLVHRPAGEGITLRGTCLA